MNDSLDQLVEIDGAMEHLLPSHAGEHKEIVNQLSHLFGRGGNRLQIAPRLVVQGLARGFREERRVAVDMPQWRPQVLRDRVTERLQLLVGGLEQFPLAPQFGGYPPTVRNVVMD